MSKRKGTSRRPCFLAAAALALLPAGSAGAQSPEAPPPPEKRPVLLDVPLPQRNPTREPEAEKEPETQPHPAEVEVPDWTAEQVAAAKAECDAMLAQLEAEYETLEPIREGRCGTPYPVRLSAVGAAPAVEIDPPATLTCDMTAALARWLSRTVQPAARERLGSAVVRIRNVSSYVCRRRYSDPDTRISEHALANALDIASFATESGTVVALADHWSAMKPRSDQPGENGEEEEEAESMEPASATQPESTNPDKSATEDGPPPAPEPKPAMVPAPEQRFLRALHDGACGIFGTVLGPEANTAHRDHFHLDRKERDYGSYCE